MKDGQTRLVGSIFLGRTFTILIVLFALVVVVTLTVNEIRERLLPGDGDGAVATRQHPTHQGTDGVILVALGVILEGRHTFVVRVMKVNHLDHLPGQEDFSAICEIFGFYVLVVGLVLECFHELVKFADFNSVPGWWFVCGISITLNSLAVLFVLQLIVKIMTIRLT